MARNEIVLEQDERRGKIVAGVSLAMEQAWKEVQEKADKLHLLRAVNKALGDKVAEAVMEVQQALNAKVSASANGHSLNG